MNAIWLPLLILFFFLLWLHSQEDPKEIARRNRDNHPVASRVGKQLGRKVAKHAKWAAPSRKRPLRRRP